VPQRARLLEIVDRVVAFGGRGRRSPVADHADRHRLLAPPTWKADDTCSMGGRWSRPANQWLGGW